MSVRDQTDAQLWLRHARAGDLEAAWRASDRIRNRAGNVRDCTAPRHLQQVWDGRPLAGQRVLIRCYHGLGDTIQFIRYAALVRPVANEVIVWAQPQLIPLLKTAAGIDRLLPLHDGAPDVGFDVDVEIMELPYVFRTVVSTIPSTVPYLSAKQAVLPGASPRIGVVWRGGSWNAGRSVPFALFAQLFDLPNIRWYSLQVDPHDAERHPRLRILDATGIVRTARYMAALDLIITIDSMTAHLAGALGLPVWTLLVRDADWRWMADRADSPWYPTMRLFRQQQASSWHPVVDEVAEALRGGLPAIRCRQRSIPAS